MEQRISVTKERFLYLCADRMVDGKVIFLNLIGLGGGYANGDVANFRKLSAALARQSDCFQTKPLGAKRGLNYIAGITGGRNAEKDIGFAVHGVNQLSVYHVRLFVVGIGAQNSTLIGERNGTNAPLKCFAVRKIFQQCGISCGNGAFE